VAGVVLLAGALAVVLSGLLPREAGDAAPGEPPPAAPGLVRPAPVARFLGDWASPVGTETDAATGFPSRIRRRRDGAEMALVPAGTFSMGAPASDEGAWADERPARDVTLTKAYYLDVTEVTNGQFERFVNETGHVTTAERTGKAQTFRLEPGRWAFAMEARTWRKPHDGAPSGDRWRRTPVSMVSWDDAAAFCAWAGPAEGEPLRLPTEAEFERALRGAHEGTPYPWGRAPVPPTRFGNYLGEEWRSPAIPSAPRAMSGFEDEHLLLAPVAAFLPNDFGIHDLSGNVWEYCADWYADSYVGASAVDPVGPPSGKKRVMRGASCFDADVRALRSSARGRTDTDWPTIRLGFRASRRLP
jgi:formylglycine-generating enzyme required for sulfatase activity